MTTQIRQKEQYLLFTWPDFPDLKVPFFFKFLVHVKQEILATVVQFNSAQSETSATQLTEHSHLE